MSAAPAHPPVDKRLRIERADHLIARKVRWLWPGRIPLGATTMLAGLPGQGKSVFTVDVAARITTLRSYPDASNPLLEAGEVLFIATEDDAESVLRPRLEAAGADLSRVHIVRSVLATIPGSTFRMVRDLRLDEDVRELRDTLKEYPGIRLVVIDPITNHLGDKSYLDEQEMRRLLRPVQSAGVAIVLVGHLNKKMGLEAMQRVGGAGAFIGLSRASWLFAADATDKTLHHLMGLKNNYAAAGGLTYRIEAVPVDVEGSPESIPRVAWVGVSEANPTDLLDSRMAASDAQTEACEFLRDFLSEGERPAEEVKTAAKAKGISEITLRRAKGKARVFSSKTGMDGGWVWRLPLEVIE